MELQIKKYLKPFLTVAKISDEVVSIGMMENYRVDLKNSLKIKKTNEINKYFDYLEKLELLNDFEGQIEEHCSRTISFLSIFSNQPLSAYEKVINTHFLILGVGGLGSRIALELASFGVKELSIVDPDFLSTSNLQRMFFFNSKDLNNNKVNLIRKKARKINPKIKVNTFCEDSILFCKSKDLQKYDFIIVTADGDDGSISKDIGRELYNSQKPHILGGYWESKLIAGPIIDKLSKTDLCREWHKSNHKVSREPKRDFIPPSTGFSNSIVGGLLLNEVIKYLVGKTSTLLDKQYQLDVLTLKSQFINLKYE